MKPILILWETHHLGDALLSLPFIRVARKDYEVRVVCRRNQAGLYRAYDPGLNLTEWEPFWAEGLRWGQRVAGFFKSVGLVVGLRKLGHHEAVSCWADVRIHLVMMACGAKRRVGLPMVAENFYALHLPWRQRKLIRAAGVGHRIERIWGQKLLTDPIFRSKEVPGHLDVWRKLGKVWGWSLDCTTPWLNLERLADGPFLEFIQRARKEGRTVWMVHPGARHPARRWPMEFFQESLRRLLEEKSSAVIFVETEGQEILSELPAWQRSCRPESLEEFMAIAGEVDVMFCNDSFPAHLAAALGKVVWTIFSDQDPALFAPFQNESRVLVKDVCEFRPCLDRCVKPSFECLEAVTVEDVVTKMLGR